MSKVCVIGLGYIGLPTASMLASRGHEVVGCDIDETAVSMTNAGLAHFREPELEMLLQAATNTRRLQAQTTPAEADYFIIAVPTPFKDGWKPDLSCVESATDSLASFLQPGNTVILESTSPVGTTEQLSARLARARPDLLFPHYKDSDNEAQIQIAHCPERILPGQMVRELVSNDRIIGGMTERCASQALALYETFVSGRFFLTDCRMAEFVKLIENSFRDVNIAFANELSVICDQLDIDVWSAINLANKHPRVSILQPGPGVGGHCIAVDPWFIVDSAPEHSRMIRLAREVNNEKTRYVVERIIKLADRFKNPTVACFGITYKPDVDDLRESPSFKVVQQLVAQGNIRVIVCDPMIEQLPSSLAGNNMVSMADADTARQEADIVAFLVAHRKFQKIPPNLFLNKIVVDTVGLMSRE